MDKYDEAIEWLVANANDGERQEYGSVVEYAWDDDEHSAHCLFQHATVSGSHEEYGHSGFCGCLTQIRQAPFERFAATEDLSDEIAADERIPKDIRTLQDRRGDELRAALQPFAEWQRRLDKEIRGVAV